MIDRDLTTATLAIELDADALLLLTDVDAACSFVEGAGRTAFIGWIDDVLPAVGYGPAQLADLAATINAAQPDVIVTGTPIDLRRVVHVAAPVRHARYELHELGHPNLSDVLAPHLATWRTP